jgi:hypothetical protein
MGRRSAAMQKFYDPSAQESVRCRTYLRSRESGSWTELGHSPLRPELGAVSFSQHRVGSSDRQRWRAQLSKARSAIVLSTRSDAPSPPLIDTRWTNDAPIPTAAVHGEVVVFAVARRDVSAEARSRTIITWTIRIAAGDGKQSTAKSVPATCLGSTGCRYSAQSEDGCRGQNQ